MKKLLYGIGIFLGIGMLFFYFFQERFLFLPGKKTPKDLVYNFPEPFQELFLETPNGASIHALHFTLENPKGMLLFFHGNRGNLERWGTLVPYFLEYNYEVLVMDYRSYGKSTGSFNEVNMYEDAVAAYEYAKQLYREDQIVVYGRSLGGTFAARVGAQFQPKQVILEAPFYNMKKAVRYHFFAAPTFLLKYSFNSNLDVPKISSPFTIFHGTEDETTSFEGSKELFQLATSTTKQFVALEGGTHHNVSSFQEYKNQLKNLLD